MVKLMAFDFGGHNVKQIETIAPESIQDSKVRLIAQADTVTDEAAFVNLMKAHSHGRAPSDEDEPAAKGAALLGWDRLSPRV